MRGECNREELRSARSVSVSKPDERHNRQAIMNAPLPFSGHFYSQPTLPTAFPFGCSTEQRQPVRIKLKPFGLHCAMTFVWQVYSITPAVFSIPKSSCARPIGSFVLTLLSIPAVYRCHSRQFCMLVFPAEMKMWKLWVLEIHPHAPWLRSHKEVFLRWALWKLFCNETSGSDAVESQASSSRAFEAVSDQTQLKSLLRLVKLNSVITGLPIKTRQPAQNPAHMCWNHSTYSNYNLWKLINVIKYICCCKDRYYD